eukprot:TRINITY_DN5418_c0_g2_i1.p3 TRINITY_DN5418_c0_g2~~TRINITY_DN5418_c0_g2_i1.p3  ORF type:complete len:144 (-),score=17.72 TRINITY_DN5418_c0_g2_i1:120-551(-)
MGVESYEGAVCMQNCSEHRDKDESKELDNNALTSSQQLGVRTTGAVVKKSCRTDEKQRIRNREAQRRFRERQKSTIYNLDMRAKGLQQCIMELKEKNMQLQRQVERIRLQQYELLQENEELRVLLAMKHSDTLAQPQHGLIRF